MRLSELKQHAPALRREAAQHAADYARNIRQARYYEKVGGTIEAKWARLNAETHLTLYKMANGALDEMFPAKGITDLSNLDV